MTKEVNDMNEMNVTTNEVRFSFVHLFRPYSATGKPEDEKYSVTCLLPKTDTVTKQRIDAAIAAATQKGIAEKWNGQAPPLVPNPIWDGDGKRSDGSDFGPECRGMWVFTAATKADRPPEVVDAALNPIMNQSDVYSGMYGNANFNVFPYAFGGKKGIGFGLTAVRKTRDGEVLGGGRITAAQAFGALVQNQGQRIDPFSGQPLPFN